MSADFPHLMPRDWRGARPLVDGQAWTCQRNGCSELCINGQLSTDCHGFGSGWPDRPRAGSSTGSEGEQ